MSLLRAGAAGRTPLLIGCALGLVCFAYLMVLPPTLYWADEAYTLYGAKRVLQGQALYRDFFEYLTPGSFYLYALAFRVGGTSITSARVTTALLNALSAACTYFLTLQVASMAEAIIAGLLVVVICVPIWNMASHHWIATAFTLATAAVLLAPRWKDSPRARPAAAGALAGALLCTNQGRGAWAILWMAITVPLLARGAGDGWRRCWRELIWTALGGAAVCLPILGYALWRSSLAEMLYATCTWVLINYRNYNVGKVHWSEHSFWHVQYTYLWLFDAIPILLGIEGVRLLWAILRHGLRSQRVPTALLLLAFSGVAAITYYPEFIHVAYVAPFALVVVAGMVYRVRSAFGFIETPAAQWIVGLGWAVALALVLAKAESNVRLAWRENPVLYESAFGRLAGAEWEPRLLHDLRQQLAVDGAAPPRLFIYPAPAFLYLALPADNPTPFDLLLPVLNTPEQIQMAIQRLEHDPQALVLLNSLVNATPDDPFVAWLSARWRDVGVVGPWVVHDTPVYRLFAPPTKG